MNINAASHANAMNSASRVVAGRQEFSAQRHEAAAEARTDQKSYNFNDMSRSEFDSLWREGKVDMRLPPLILPSNGLDLTKDTKAQMEAVYDEKIDFIQHFQQRMEFQNTQPSTEANRVALKFYEDGLNILNNLKGETIKSCVDLKA